MKSQPTAISLRYNKKKRAVRANRVLPFSLSRRYSFFLLLSLLSRSRRSCFALSMRVWRSWSSSVFCAFSSSVRARSSAWALVAAARASCICFADSACASFVSLLAWLRAAVRSSAICFFLSSASLRAAAISSSERLRAASVSSLMRCLVSSPSFSAAAWEP